VSTAIIGKVLREHGLGLGYLVEQIAIMQFIERNDLTLEDLQAAFPSS